MTLFDRKQSRLLCGKIHADSCLRRIFFVCRERDITLACAESCTGGLFSGAVSSKAGASSFFLGGVVAYSNAVKEEVLGVREETIRSFGAVSEETAAEMARGAAELFHADAAVAISGIAGPAGGSKGKPVGTVIICALFRGAAQTARFEFSGSRRRVQMQSVKAALFLLQDVLEQAEKKREC